MKVYIITCHNCYNFGASLQAFALQKYIKDSYEADCKTIHYVPYYMDYSVRYKRIPKKWSSFFKKIIWCAYHHPIIASYHFRRKKFDHFLDSFISHTKKVTTYNKIITVCNDGDVFICGSDQIWNGMIYENGKDPSFFLSFVNSGKKISYAASFGGESVSPITEKLIPNLKDFSGVSVREEKGRKILEKYNISSEVVVDPVFLISREEWSRLSCLTKSKKRNYILVYGLDNLDALESIAKKYSSRYKIIVIGEMGFKNKNVFYFKNAGPLDFLYLVKNAVYVITNSFHCIAFSLIFGIPFMVLKREVGINQRIDNLLSLCGIADEAFQDDINKNMCFDEYWKHINLLVEKSKDFLSRSFNLNEKQE